MSIKQTWIHLVHELQNNICAALEAEDGQAVFKEDKWEREDGGGGITRVISNGKVFEKGGVNTSVVHGDVTNEMRNQLKIHGAKWFACGVSLVLHPKNPFVPTVHCNYRMFELYNEQNEVIDRWFGGGTDLTPYYLFQEDAKHFHQTYKDVCDAFDVTAYEQYKKICDDYFVNKHRNNERRGIGGIFYDYKRATPDRNSHYWIDFAKACGQAFIPAYLAIVQKRKEMAYTPENKFWQEIRRGRYVEFNLVHDRGTVFGLKTNGRTESILMSLPPTVRFEYDYTPLAGSEEDKLLQVCLHPIDWTSLPEIDEDDWAKKVNMC
ncbi:oxygen-dependent coproporphyrinogen oxidase [Limnovirga soli]|uniref:coproporphyrinogen oxidase n=1 Tax=Limnovirga soli TaxID=2656915 RepID=A0A8J8JUT6_9BACT|nr:oxygen-dependent coproporphyrinogen oxidase [Limnovirga soli]NNV55924.1 oxygen-dependent coproporphyrinogen oxidase [Limnovirga soli]